MVDFIEIVKDSPTHIDGGLLDRVYVHKHTEINFTVTTLVKCVSYSDHNTIKIKIENHS